MLLDLKSRVPFIICIESKEDLEKIQLILFSHGFGWLSSKRRLLKEFTYLPYYIRADNDFILYTGSKMIFKETMAINNIKTILKVEDILKY